MLDIAAVCLVVTALLAYVNHRFIGLPTTIGVMATALALSLAAGRARRARHRRRRCATTRNRCCARSTSPTC